LVDTGDLKSPGR